MKSSLVWIRNDLRFEDNTALIEAVKNTNEGEKLGMIFYLDKEQFKFGSYSHDYFFFALHTFYKDCSARNLELHFLYGDLEECFSELLQKFPDIKRLYFNMDDSGYGEVRDERIKALCSDKKIDVFAYSDRHIHSAKEVVKEDGSHYKVFTPYYQKWRAKYPYSVQKMDYDKLSKLDTFPFSEKENEGKRKFMEIIEKIERDFSEQTGEKKAKEALYDFVKNRLCSYHENRDYPYIEGTSRLSKFLSTGQLSVREVYQSVLKASDSKGRETFIKELAWRDFYNMIYHFYPKQKEEEIIEKYRTIHWQSDAERFKLWKEGKTGFPIVDAAMRQLKKEGWMHNRLRMIVASFFTKDLLMDWRLGEKYFSEMLIDYDSASNIGGWQWAASVGTDAVPYFRVFNPNTQGEKFDPEGKFIKRYVEELQAIPIKYLNEPFKYAKQIKKECNIDIEKQYYAPMVNHKEQRLMAISLFRISE